jgi:hypothetical protein
MSGPSVGVKRLNKQELVEVGKSSLGCFETRRVAL